MKRTNTRYFVTGLIVFTLILAGAYAILTTTLNITGTATGTGDFKLEFTNVNVTNDLKATATTTTDNTTITISTNLSFPGDTVTTNFTISNTGSLPAKVDNLTINNPDSTDFTVQIIGLDNIVGTTLPVGDTTVGSIVVTWNISSTNPTPEEISFNISIDYSQATS
jgi:hypothetical protein